MLREAYQCLPTLTNGKQACQNCVCGQQLLLSGCLRGPGEPLTIVHGRVYAHERVRLLREASEGHFNETVNTNISQGKKSKQQRHKHGKKNPVPPSNVTGKELDFFPCHPFGALLMIQKLKEKNEDRARLCTTPRTILAKPERDSVRANSRTRFYG